MKTRLKVKKLDVVVLAIMPGILFGLDAGSVFMGIVAGVVVGPPAILILNWVVDKTQPKKPVN